MYMLITDIYDEKVNSDRIKEVFNSESHFKNERELTDFLIENMTQFLYCIGDNGKVMILEKEFRVKSSVKQKGVPNIRYDLVVYTENNIHLFEVKKPTHAHTELRAGIAQCMEYGLKFQGARIYLVTDKHDDIATDLIRNYGLDINYIVVNKNSISIMEGQWPEEKQC